MKEKCLSPISKNNFANIKMGNVFWEKKSTPIINKKGKSGNVMFGGNVMGGFAPLKPPNTSGNVMFGGGVIK